jgi:hypothetical protein
MQIRAGCNSGCPDSCCPGFGGARQRGQANRGTDPASVTGRSPRPAFSLSDMTDAIRSASQRRADTMARLEHDADVWAATANAGRPHLVSLSLAWDGVHVILATPADSPTARNAATSGNIRLALGSSRDVTIIEAAVHVVSCADAKDSIAQCYSPRTGWDPRREDVQHVYLIATPRTARAWRSLPEIPGRTIMRSGHWMPD